MADYVMSSLSDAYSVGFVSLGCAKNRVDSQIMAGALLEHGIALAATPETADIIIVNTCSFIADAREESLSAIAEVCEWKRAGQCRAVLVAGCLPQRYRCQIREALPDVDAFIGLDALDEVPRLVKALASGRTPLSVIPPHAKRLYEPQQQVVFSEGANAYLKIAEGCNHHCAFCAIPGIRGRFRSRSVEHILMEAIQLANKGFKELDLIAQDITAYGCDNRPAGSLVRLLNVIDDGLAAIETDLWIRLLYAYPTGITMELLETMAGLARVVPYLDVPVQHSHPEILRTMRRGNTVKPVNEIVTRARSVMPGITLRTTCLVGYPGETDDHIQHLMEFLDASRFDHVGVFCYSPEDNTSAVLLGDVPDPEVAASRRQQILELQRRIVDQKAQELLGNNDRFLLDAPTNEKGLWRTRSVRQSPESDGVTYLTKVPANAERGMFLQGYYVAASDYDMVAEYSQKESQE